MSHTWVLASHNAGKLREFQQLLAGLGLQLRNQADFHLPSVAETGLTFVENALIKARYASEASGLPALADDSGLAVHALQGAPGIYSARYAGEDANDAANNQKLVQQLQGVPWEQRGAEYVCALVYLRHPLDPTPIICQGRWQGVITETPAGTAGFGYDPYFYVPSHQCTSAQLPAGVKNALSHRGKAMAQLLELVRAELTPPAPQLGNP